MVQIHTPVLLKEVCVFLNIRTGDVVIDATLDGGGHAAAMLEIIGLAGRLLGIEQDKEIVKIVEKKNNVFVALGGFEDIESIAKKFKFTDASAILFDLGMSSWHIRESGKGFSFDRPKEPLSMRFRDFGKTAAEIINSYNREEIAWILKNYGDVRRSGIVAKRITDFRKRTRIVSVEDFIEALRIKNRKVLAKIFQAIRISVNSELERLEKGIAGAFKILKPGGRIAVISYHSLEDRTVKGFFKGKASEKSAVLISKKPILPSFLEIQQNPSARSAKLRILEKII